MHIYSFLHSSAYETVPYNSVPHQQAISFSFPTLTEKQHSIVGFAPTNQATLSLDEPPLRSDHSLVI